MTRYVVLTLSRVCLLTLLTVFMSAATASAQTTALFFESQAGDYIGAGQTHTYTPADGIFEVRRNYDQGVGFTVRSSNYSFWWYLDLAGAGSIPLAVGSYPAAKRYPFTVGNGLSFSGSGRGCNELTGRFEVLEVALAADGTVLRFAADFEQHCEDANPGLFGAIRYNSTISDLRPFQGNYPRYEFTITPQPHGRVTGAGFDCGSGQATCQVTLATPSNVTITATPDAGYVFAGWTGDCEGRGATTTLRLNSAKTCEAFFEPQVPTGPRTLLYWDSEPGDYIGQGVAAVYSGLNSVWAVTTNSWRDQVQVRVESGTHYWTIDISGPNGVALTPGYYGGAQRSAFALFNGLDAHGSGRGCNRLTGRFIILEFVTNPDGTVARFAADFEQHCEDANPGLFGAIRYNSTIGEVVPFGGAYPLYQLTVTPHAYGRVTGAGLNCGSGNAVCQATQATAGSVTLTATPDTGYVFTGWTGDCAGSAATATLRLNSVKSCNALFEPHVPTGPRSVLYWDSEPGDYIGQGIDGVYAPSNSEWKVSTTSARDRIEISVTSPTNDWRLTFSAPRGVALAPGYYGAARRSPFALFNGLSASGSGRGCNQLTGRFVILEFATNSDGTVARFAADFEQHCEDANPGLFGAIRYNSTVSDVVPFQGNYPRYELTITPDAHGRVTATGLNCGSTGSMCQTVLGAPATLALTATADPGYVFAGWVGDCEGPAAVSVRVNSAKGCTALFEPLVTTSARTFLFVDSDSNDGTGGRRKVAHTLANSVWTFNSSSTNGNRVSLRVEAEPWDWSFDFSAPIGQSLVPGYYSAARRYPFTSFNGFSVGGCNDLTGRFVILEFVLGPNNIVQRFAADFEEHCNDNPSGTFGVIRYNSTISNIVPFEGAYPSYQLTMATPSHGRVTGPAMNCGGGNTQCVLSLAGPTQVALTATPDFGYLFAGWSEDCSGGTTTTLHVNGPKRCAARFEPIAPVAPRTLARVNRSPDSYLPGGWSGVLSPANSRWLATRYGAGVYFTLESVGPRAMDRWFLRFEPPTDEGLEIGRRYTGAQRFAKAGVAGMDVYGDLPSCGSSTAEFTVRQLVLGTGDTVVRFAVDFVQSCSATGPTITGSLQYESTIDVPSTTLTVEPAALRFAALHNGASITVEPAPQALRLAVSRADVGWTATANQSWITITPASGTGSTALTVAANLLGGHPGAGSASGVITIALTDGTGTVKTVTLDVSLHPTGTTTQPFGTIDTPLPDRTGVTGAIPITGWALDDIEIASITICRAAVAGESAPADVNCGGAAQIYIGNAVVIEGARPDVQAAYATYPRNDAAGWGFLLLTNTLPNQGNGTFTFHVYARDREGQVVQLGTRTMTCDNAHAAVPFGTIDTPVQGETVNGASYVNFGWALTQNPKTIPIDGSTLMVYVDGVPVGNPSYNHYRPDIATIFPGYANSNGAVGFKIIDTTALSNGLHTIVWTATDDAGAIAGLGSRFFRVLNGTMGSLTATSVSAEMTAAVSSERLAALPLESSPLVARRGWSPEAPWGQYVSGRSGRAVLRGEELDRFELALGAETGDRYTGYLRVGDRLRPLPAGSRLEPVTGVFTWSPGVGFVGTYDVVFVRAAGGQPVARREVRFILQPKGSGYVGVQAVIDAPGADRDVVQPVAVSGWAVDLDAPSGTGITTLHAWAYPVTGGAPVFVGATSTSGHRPDVAALHGDQFREAGFSLVVQTLPPGTYDLAVFPWSTVIGAFAPPQSVRVTVR
jgi:hypothetical protein